MTDKILDMTLLTDDEFAAVAKGFERFKLNIDGPSYFGQVTKRNLKTLNRAFNYTDGRSFAKGMLFTSCCVVAAHVLERKLKEKKDSEEV